MGMMAQGRIAGRLIRVAVLAMILLAVLVVPGVWAEGEPGPGTVEGIVTHTYYEAATSTAGAASGTLYSSAPRRVSGQDISLVRSFYSVDVFATVDMAGSDVVTITPQFSANQSDWADADYSYVADNLSQTTTVLTSTGVTTATSTTSQSSSITWQTYQTVFSADGTDYLRLPVAGEYLRFKIEYSTSTTSTITPTILATLRNN